MAHDFLPNWGLYLVGHGAVEPYSHQLANQAFSMFEDDSKVVQVRLGGLEGELRTDFDFQCFPGGITGMVFDGNFDVEGFDGTANVRFLVHSCKLTDYMAGSQGFGMN
jgi:hypothetical protein